MNRRVFLSGTTAGLFAGFTPWSASAQAQHTPIGYLRTNWSLDPFSFGSYSYIAKHAGRRDHQTLGKPIQDRIFFAGEATHPTRNSTVHSAYESGLRAANFVMMTSAYRVGIIGAGISGLAAAQTLAQSGLEVSIAEARDRIGGRIWSNARLGKPLDLGASWIHGTEDNPLTELANDLDLARLPTDESYIARDRYGGRIRNWDSPDWLDQVLEIQHSLGANLSQINSSAYEIDSDYSGDEVIFPGGYSEILSALEGDYEIHLNTPVTAITLNENEVGVSIASQADVDTFDAVIVTVPLGVLKQNAIKFSPPLPQEKQNAIQRLGMGLLDKVYLQFTEVFWDESKTWIATPQNGLPQGQFNQWLNLAKYIDEPVIVAFNGGPPAHELAELPDELIVMRALQTLNLAYP